MVLVDFEHVDGPGTLARYLLEATQQDRLPYAAKPGHDVPFLGPAELQPRQESLEPSLKILAADHHGRLPTGLGGVGV